MKEILDEPENENQENDTTKHASGNIIVLGYAVFFILLGMFLPVLVHYFILYIMDSK